MDMILAAAWGGLTWLLRALGTLVSLVIDPLSLLPSGRRPAEEAPPETEQPGARQVIAGDPPRPVEQPPRWRPAPPDRGAEG